VLGVLPAKSIATGPAKAVAAKKDVTPELVVASTPAKATVAPRETKPRTGWIVQVGAFPDENEARQHLAAARSKAAALLGKADPFTEPVTKGEQTLYRARFAGLKPEQAEAVCRQLKRSDIACIAIRN
jgi:D-alanyl-D-alanine carboxypeptidase